MSRARRIHRTLKFSKSHAPASRRRKRFSKNRCTISRYCRSPRRRRKNVPRAALSESSKRPRFLIYVFFLKQKFVNRHNACRTHGGKSIFFFSFFRIGKNGESQALTLNADTKQLQTRTYILLMNHNQCRGVYVYECSRRYDFSRCAD